MSWFEKLIPSRIRTEASQKKGIPEGIWSKCGACNAILYRAELERNLEVCPKCDYHSRVKVRKRIDQFLDPEGLLEIAANSFIFNNNLSFLHNFIWTKEFL